MLRAIPYPPPRTMVSGDFPSHAQQPGSPVANGQRSVRRPSDSPSVLAKTYKTCANLFLTRRLPEALSTLQPVVTGPAFSKSTSRATRTKLWNLYLAILDTAVKMGPDEGKHVWGSQEWRKLVGKVRTGAVWDEANRAYGGEGELDGDVANAL